MHDKTAMAYDIKRRGKPRSCRPARAGAQRSAAANREQGASGPLRSPRASLPARSSRTELSTGVSHHRADVEARPGRVPPGLSPPPTPPVPTFLRQPFLAINDQSCHLGGDYGTCIIVGARRWRALSAPPGRGGAVAAIAAAPR